MTTSCLAKKIIFKQNSKIIFIDSTCRHCITTSSGTMKKLLVWEYALQSMDEAEKMEFPRVSSGVLGLSKSNPKKIRSSLFHTHCSSFKTGRQAPP